MQPVVLGAKKKAAGEKSSGSSKGSTNMIEAVLLSVPGVMSAHAGNSGSATAAAAAASEPVVHD